MELVIVDNEKSKRFETEVEGYTAFVEYVKTEDQQLLAVTSTQVPKELEGRGIAAILTKHVLDYAKANNLKVDPICSYTIAYFKKHPEYDDLLKEKE